MAILVQYTDPSPNVQGTTRAAPTLVTEGLDLTGVKAYRIIVSADSTKVLHGAGNMRAWVWSLLLTRWVRDMQLDFPVTPSGSTWVNVRDISTGDTDLSVALGRMFWQADGVDADAGNITTQIEAQRDA